MLTLKQSPVALFSIFLACGLAGGNTNQGKLITALCLVAFTVIYVLICNNSNQIKDAKRKDKTGMYR